jgi:hypothetical protein
MVQSHDMSDFQGFDLGGVERIEVRSFVIGPGQSAELVEATVEIWRHNAAEPETHRYEFGEGRGMTVAGLQALVTAINRWLRQRREEG